MSVIYYLLVGTLFSFFYVRNLNEKEINDRIGRPDLKNDIDSIDFFLKEL